MYQRGRGGPPVGGYYEDFNCFQYNQSIESSERRRQNCFDAKKYFTKKTIHKQLPGFLLLQF